MPGAGGIDMPGVGGILTPGAGGVWTATKKDQLFQIKRWGLTNTVDPEAAMGNHQ
jgi:hypothetical protein